MNSIKERSFLPFMLFLAALLLFGAQSGESQERERGLVLQMDVKKEIKVQRGNDQETITVPVETTNPGDILVYTISYINTRESVVQNASVVDPIPKGAEYLPGSASGEGTKITYSINNGRTFYSPPVKQIIRKPDGTREEKTATPDMYTHIKWNFNIPLSPGQTGLLKFKATVK
ncbi:hypothetical protein ACFL6W_06485 [Thermodesulfobacteriota bacterium]